MSDQNYDIDLGAVNKTMERVNRVGGGGSMDKRQFRPKPMKDGQKYTNRIFISSLKPKSIPGYGAYPLDHRVFWVELRGHYVTVPGETKDKTYFVLCPKTMNAQMASLSGDKDYKMYEDDRCASCEKAAPLWDRNNARWAELGYPDWDSKKALSKDQYKEIGKDPELTATREYANALSVKSRYAIPVYDMEQQPMATGYQWLFAPEGVFKELMDLVLLVRFWSLNPNPQDPDAVEGKEILLIRDNSKGARFCEYSVRDNRDNVRFAADELAYLKETANIPPLFDLVEVWTYEKHLATLEGTVEGEENQEQAPPPPSRTAPARTAPARTAPPAVQQAMPAQTAAPTRTAPTAPARTTAPSRTAPQAAIQQPQAQAPVQQPVAAIQQPQAQAPVQQPVAAIQQPAPNAAAQAQAPGANPAQPRPRRTW